MQIVKSLFSCKTSTVRLVVVLPHLMTRFAPFHARPCTAHGPSALRVYQHGDSGVLALLPGVAGGNAGQFARQQEATDAPPGLGLKV